MGNAAGAGKLVFTFPGQGSYHAGILGELFTSYSYGPRFEIADRISRRILGHAFLPLAQTANPAQREQALKTCPDLDQVAIYVTEVLLADILMSTGIRPDLLLGHSFGELAALAVGGAYSFETGLRIVCQRCLALRPLTGAGQMAAVSCGPEQAGKLMQALAQKTLQIAVVNHERQTVLSGDAEELRELAAAAARQGVNLTILKSRYPFHSSLLGPAVAPFRMALCSYTFQAPATPVYLGTANRFYGAQWDLADVLPDQFIERLDFAAILRRLAGSGYRRFIECGAGDVLTGITLKALSGTEGLICRPAAHPDSGVSKGTGKIRQEFEPNAPAQAPDSVPELLRDVQSVLERTASTLRTVTQAPSLPSQAEPEREPQETAEASQEPIAIVAMGCVLPGARDPEEYWDHIQSGVSGIVDLAREDPAMARDFLARGNGTEIAIVPDKTYTLLHGSVGSVAYDAALLSRTIDEARFGRLSRAEKLLALATAQSLAGFAAGLEQCPGDRLQCILGATGDGCGEYDDALFLENLSQRLEAVEADPGARAKASAILKKAWGDPPAGSPTSNYREVVQTVLGRPVQMYVVDAACSSSLYSVYLGMKALQNHSADVVLAGGVFAPGPANNTLFAQFRGLTPAASRPLDAAADGVVFGDGAGVLILKRLTDAVAQGDRIAGVVRAMGVSSDGKSPAINVPQKKGQSLAIHRAYAGSGIETATIQYVEAHATGTPVGDAVEFQALRESIPRSAAGEPIELGSVKSLIGHTGWAAGVASIIKLCKAFEARTVPGQYNFSHAGPEIPLEGSQFAISRTSHPWPGNRAGLPRRAAINGFGFGGTNAHLVLEEYDSAYHRTLCGRVPATPAPQLAVIHWAALFPASGQLWASAAGAERRFHRPLLRLPKGKMLLPDVRDHMDACQFLVTLAAEQVLSKIPDQWPKLRSEIGVVLGVDAKTERGTQANERIFLDKLRRRVAECAPGNDASRIVDELTAAIRNDIIPSGPYTLSGLMPNVVAGRVTHMFDLNGPNIVVDRGANSLFQAISAAADFLADGVCKIVLAGGVNAAQTSSEHAEAAFMMALTTPEIAHQLGLPVECQVSIGATDNGAIQAASPEVRNYRGAHGIVEIAAALAGNTGQAIHLRQGFRPVPQTPASRPQPEAPPSSAYAYVQGTPIYHYTPVVVPAEPDDGATPVSLRSRKVLFLIDRPERWVEWERSGALAGLNFQVLGPMDSEEALVSSLERLAGSYDTIVAVQNLDESTASSLLDRHYPALPDLLFTACRHTYAAIESRQVWVASLSLNAFRSGKLDPHTGLSAGFMKALARELPNAVCRIIDTDETNFSTALRQVEAELTRASGGAEICYRAGKRHGVALAPVEQLTDGSGAALDANSVVLATGGGRGVTAVLAEELLDRFGCTVIALGRTDPASAPPQILAMDETQLARYERPFYQQRLAQSPGTKIAALKKEYQALQAAHEIHRTVDRLSGRPGRFEYRHIDLTDGQAVAAMVESVFRKYGRVDLVLHGAGMQVSKALPKKSLRDFRSVVSAKLDGLRYIYQGCQKHGQSRPTHYHLLTSAFSYLGNDGQGDYGAANEAMNRLAAVMNKTPQHGQWTSVAWLGWAGIGMTRGSEYAALAASRRLRGVTREEGRRIFSELLSGSPAAPINILMADGEIEYYKAKTVSREKDVALPPARGNSRVIEREVSAETAPYVWNHLVDGIPTLPGAFLIMLIAEAALELRPNLKVTAFEDAAFRRFVRMRREGATPLRLHANVIAEDAESTLVRVAILADFVHKSGVVLQKDVEQTAISVRLASGVAPAPGNGGISQASGRPLEDPYLMDGSPVKLNGPFQAMHNITAGQARRWADYRLRAQASSRDGYRYLLPNLIMMDALWRFGAIHRDGQETFPIYVPETCKVMKIYYDFANPDEKALTGDLTFDGANPRLEEGRLTIGPVEARDPSGRPLVMVDGGVCRKMGEARNGH